jgi:hypothetical protein
MDSKHVPVEIVQFSTPVTESINSHVPSVFTTQRCIFVAPSDYINKSSKSYNSTTKNLKQTHASQLAFNLNNVLDVFRIKDFLAGLAEFKSVDRGFNPVRYVADKVASVLGKSAADATAQHTVSGISRVVTSLWRPSDPILSTVRYFIKFIFSHLFSSEFYAGVASGFAVAGYGHEYLLNKYDQTPLARISGSNVKICDTRNRNTALIAQSFVDKNLVTESALSLAKSKLESLKINHSELIAQFREFNSSVTSRWDQTKFDHLLEINKLNARVKEADDRYSLASTDVARLEEKVGAYFTQIHTAEVKNAICEVKVGFLQKASESNMLNKDLAPYGHENIQTSYSQQIPTIGTVYNGAVLGVGESFPLDKNCDNGLHVAQTKKTVNGREIIVNKVDCKTWYDNTSQSVTPFGFGFVFGLSLGGFWASVCCCLFRGKTLPL